MESRRLLSGAPDIWTGGGDGVHWSNGDNWSLGVPPSGDALISVPANPTIQLDIPASITSLTCTENLVISGSGSLMVSGATSLMNGGQLGIPTNAATLNGGVTVGAGGQLEVNGGSLTVSGGASVEGSGAELLLAGGTVLLSRGTSNINMGGQLMVTGGSVTVDGSGASLTADGSQPVTRATLRAQDGAVLTLRQSTALSNAQLFANGGGRLLFPSVTTYTGSNSADTTIKADGSGSKIDLSHLLTFNGGGHFTDMGGYHALVTHVLPTAGAVIDLAGAVSINAGSGLNDFTLDNSQGVLGVGGITAMSNTALADNGGVPLNFQDATALAGVDLMASGGTQLQFPAATTYTGSNSADTTIKADGSGSKIDLSHLLTFNGGGHFTDMGGYHALVTHVLPTAGAVIDLAGAVSINAGSGLNDFTVTGDTSVLGMAPVASIAQTDLTAAAGTTLVLAQTDHMSFGPAVLIRTAEPTGSFENDGTLTTTSNGDLTIAVGHFVNVGSIRATNGGRVDLSADTVIDGSGALGASSQGQVRAAGALTNNGDTAFDTGGFLTVAGALVINNGKSVNFANNASPVISTIGALTMNGTGVLDLGNNALDIHYGSGASPDSQVRSLIVSGRNGGLWNGQGVISTDAAARHGSFAVGYADGSNGVVSGMARGDEIIKLARIGDVNLDGTVAFSDLLALAQRYPQPAGAKWDGGDFDYDGQIGFSDLLLLAQNYGDSVATQPFALADVTSLVARHQTSQRISRSLENLR